MKIGRLVTSRTRVQNLAGWIDGAVTIVTETDDATGREIRRDTAGGIALAPPKWCRRRTTDGAPAIVVGWVGWLGPPPALITALSRPWSFVVLRLLVRRRGQRTVVVDARQDMHNQKERA